MNSLVKKAIAECIGTFVLVFCAVGAATCNFVEGTSLAFGLVIVAMAYSIGRISGCHINPAVSLGCLLTKRMNAKEFCYYVVAQVIGGLLGAITLFGAYEMAGQGFADHTGCNQFFGNFNYDKLGAMFAAILVEVILTCIFVYVILNVTDNNATEGDEYKKGTGQIAGIIIGLTLCLVHLVGCGMTGTSVNPARSLATAFADLIFNGTGDALAVLPVFIVAPLAGGALAAVLFNFLHGKDEEVAEVKADDTKSE